MFVQVVPSVIVIHCVTCPVWIVAYFYPWLSANVYR